MVAESARSFRHRFEGPFWRKVLLGGLRSIPSSLREASMPLWAALFWAGVPEARRSIERNLRQVLGDVSEVELKRRSYQLFLNYAHAVAYLYLMHLGEELPIIPEFKGYEQLKPTLDAKRGAIAVTAHFGFWQITPLLCARRPWLPPITMAMAEEPNSQLAAFEEQLRKRMRIVYTTASPFASLELASVVRRGEFVGMQMDRHVGSGYGLFDFFGKPAAFPIGPATLARATEAPLVPVLVVVAPDRKRVTLTLETPIEVRRTRDRHADVLDATRRVVEVYERYVRAHPELWFNFQDFWALPDTPPTASRTEGSPARKAS